MVAARHLVKCHVSRCRTSLSRSVESALQQVAQSTFGKSPVAIVALTSVGR